MRPHHRNDNSSSGVLWQDVPRPLTEGTVLSVASRRTRWEPNQRYKLEYQGFGVYALCRVKDGKLLATLTRVNA